MLKELEPVERLTDMFRMLEGVGKKTASRYAYNVLRLTPEEAVDFAQAIVSAKTDIHECPVCHGLTTSEKCDICADEGRDRHTICVVEDAKAVMVFEKTGRYNGVYHVLGGAISPLKGVSPSDLNIDSLIERINNDEVSELILATNPTVDGDATASYISMLASPLGIRITRIANGVPVGGDLEYADEVTLRRALEGRFTL